MNRPPRNLTVLVAKVGEEARRRFDEGIGAAEAWLETMACGAPDEESCVMCRSKCDIEWNHVAGKRHGDLEVPMCATCHRRFTARQLGYHPCRADEPSSPILDEWLLLRGLALLCEERSRWYGAAYAELAERLVAVCAAMAMEARA